MKLFIFHFYQETILWLQDEDKTFERKVNERAISSVFYNLIEDILKESKKDYSDIEYIAFINGPGSFTSLRFFLTFIKALSVSYPTIKMIPLNILEVMAFSLDGENDIVMGGSRKFLKYFHHAKYFKSNTEFTLIKEIEVTPYDKVSKLNPLYIGVEPDFDIKSYTPTLNDMKNISEYKIKNSLIEDIISLTPYYYKSFRETI